MYVTLLINQIYALFKINAIFLFWILSTGKKKNQECIDHEQKFEEWHWSGHRLHQYAINKNFKNATEK